MAKGLKPDKEIVVQEILHEIEFFGITYNDCLDLNSSKWGLPRTTFTRYWNAARTRYQEATERTKKALEGVRIAEEKKALKKAIMGKHERMEILTKIARQELLFEKEVPSKGGAMLLNAIPDYTDIKAAIAELNKMDGEYAPIRKDITTEDKSPKKIIVKVKRREDN